VPSLRRRSPPRRRASAASWARSGSWAKQKGRSRCGPAHANAVIAAIHAVARGEVVLDPALARELVARASGGAPSRALLSHHELDILGLAARGLRTREIADQIGVSGRTVEAHFTNIFNKLGVTSRTEAIVRAAARGWLTLQDEGSPQLGRQRRQGRLR
jgi:DNA-binding CsgD family transcriptional regulator